MKKKMFSIVLWGTIFLMALVGVDRFLTTTPLKLPMLADVQHFYLDFRGRLAALVGFEDDAISEVIEPPPKVLQSAQQTATKVVQKAAAVVSTEARKTPKQTELKYLYVDDQGQLNFTTSFTDIPAEFRKSAELLKD